MKAEWMAQQIAQLVQDAQALDLQDDWCDAQRIERMTQCVELLKQAAAALGPQCFDEATT